MTTRNIDDQLRQYYLGAALEPASLERLRGVLTKTGEGSARPAERRDTSTRAWRVVALAASITVVFLAAAVLVLREPASDAPRVATAGLSERLAQEAARRHGRCIEEIDFQAEDLERLVAQMQKIDFTAGVPTRRALDRMKVKGAHYCVLDGQIAIHAVLVDESGEIVSLFETKAGPNLASLRSASHRMGRNDIDLWQESGVLYAAVFSSPAV
ncbi:MAG: hypothetical protein NDJ92_14205 [Thermoanaerobaculia bacterium]|nr:hypothetical protein [Thermoanaerobaculia bacterium]